MRMLLFQYRKRYVRVATACLETRPQTGLKWQIGKPFHFFHHFALYSCGRFYKCLQKYAFMPVFMPFSAPAKKLENLISNFPLL